MAADRSGPGVRFTVAPPPPYALDRTVERFSRFVELVDLVDDGVYRRLLYAGSSPVLLSVRQRGRRDRPELEVRLQGRGARSAAARRGARQILDRSLGIATDVRPLQVDDLERARRFYGELLGCAEGRVSARWVDLDFFGHQVTLHLVAETTRRPEARGPVDGDRVPVPHFGVVLDPESWRAAAERLRAGGVEFVIEPHVRFPGQVGEQSTLFCRDPSGNAIELKAFRDPARLFAREEPDK